MKLISEHIKLLLHEHECVIVPGLGGFIKNREDASFRKETGEFKPVAQLPFFNNQLKNNDGLLAASLVEKDGLSYAEARKETERFVASVKEELENHRVLQLRGLGSLAMNQEGQIIFSPEKEVNLNIDAYGLPVIRVTQVKKNEKVSKDRPALKPERKGAGKKILVPVIMVLFLASGFFAFFYNDQAIPKQLGILNPFELDSSREEVKQVQQAPVINEETPAVAENTDTSTEPVTETPESVAEPTPVAVSDSVFYIVVGAFSSEKNAARFESQLKEEGFSAVSYNGDDSRLIRVCAEQHHIRFEAEERLGFIQREANPQAWILAVKK